MHIFVVTIIILCSMYDYFKGVSFDSISAFADNAAVIHYRPTPETTKQIDKSSVYLLDSGGQYMYEKLSHNF